MSGLMRGMIDQVLKNMGENERAQSVNYVTDKMVAEMDNAERVELLMAILDRVMSNLSADERIDLASRVAGKLDAGAEAPVAAVPATPERADDDPLLGGAAIGPTDDGTAR